MGNIDWNHPRSWEEVCQRHAARRRRVLELVLALGVHRSTVCKDLRRLLPLATPCPTCGANRVIIFVTLVDN